MALRSHVLSYMHTHTHTQCPFPFVAMAINWPLLSIAYLHVAPSFEIALFLELQLIYTL